MNHYRPRPVDTKFVRLSEGLSEVLSEAFSDYTALCYPSPPANVVTGSIDY
jgi:hypothetical protein